MRLNDIIVESQQIDELSAGDIGRGVGKVAGGVAKGVGAVAGGVAGLGKAFKKGFTTGKATVAGDEDPNAADDAAAPTAAADINKAGPKGTAAAKAQTGAAAQAINKTAQATAGANPEQAGQTVYAQVKSQINNLDKKGKQRILQLLQKSMAQPAAKPAAKSAAAPAATPATAPAADTTAPASEPVTPFGSEPAATAPAADATAAPTRTQGGGKVAGQQSQTPGAIKKRRQRAAAAAAPAAEPEGGTADQDAVDARLASQGVPPEEVAAQRAAREKTVAARKPRGKKAAQPSQAEIDADREAKMGPTSDSIIRTGNNLSETLAQRILEHKQRQVREGQVKIFR